MLDVHPPHEHVHTWKDFFIHVATICVGLLIAVGLEQTVEWLHHKSEIRETRRLLKEERAGNVKSFHSNVRYARISAAFLENDLRIFHYLQQHPGTPSDKLPGVPVFSAPLDIFSQASWTSAKQSNILTLMPQAEVEESRQLYEALNEIGTKESALWDAFSKAAAYRLDQPDPAKLTSAKVDAEIVLIEECLRINGNLLVDLWNVPRRHGDFLPGPSGVEFYTFEGDVQDPQKNLPTAWAFTKHDLDEVEALGKADELATRFAQEVSERGGAHLPEIYDQFHTKYPEFKLKQSWLGFEENLFLQEDDLSALIEACKLEVQLYPGDWNAWDSLGEAYAKSGKKKLAIEIYQHAHQLNPTDPSPIEALHKLQK